MQEFVLNIIVKYGYIGVMVLIIIENIFPPIPSEIILLFGGFLTGYSELNLFVMTICATLGSLLGALILYLLGRFISIEKIKKFIKGKWGNFLKLKEDDIDRANNWFQKKSNKAVFLCRFVPLVRSLISLPAGMSKMSIIQFILYTVLGSFIWNIILIFLGNLVGDNWVSIANLINEYSLIISLIIVIVVVIGIACFYYRRLKDNKNKIKK